ncbi:hypothetical protein [Tenacibaculum finnmarkense]|uniref:hypothetical protein n=1 Tax=Tenacibaculum finnmarkense TaxID=2781243 RepID=UPI001E4E5C68|nr:hypothetical protein [Tenacibaculum finnmarkense]MCD8423127.1 hypothetical protein [Tenacibaculum finnmarkense genomovar ulcerans]MCD8443581.1 hypothetical protein [Tenacibaculum finnmarkense genomovar ulcerans]MCG8239342.1 hypothetical protein [Tenacibaculum finnmarkense genomovar ulcerans]MCG8796170.1 glycosyltransferase family 4 protein [Tenacibaculum finnmarkense]MCG8798278.1 glycosyltransferase family 4 protein [Tenacibaculum finnmarkense]
MDRIIFHIPNKINENLASGSQIRPIKMLNAFKKIGYQVDVVMGDVKQRKQQINQIKNNIKQGIKYSFLYSESSTMPTALTESHHLPVAPFLDFNFFKFCKKNEIKIGLFYRDVYWIFEEYKEKTVFYKRILAILFYKFDLYYYNKILDVLFLPSKLMYDYLPIKVNCKVIDLPPAISNVTVTQNIKKSNKIDFIYIGGISSIYDIKLFTKVVHDIGLNSINLCTRKPEWNVAKKDYEPYSKCIKVYHKSGNELDEIYNKSSVALYFVKPQEIWSFAMGVKLFEYLSYRKPIIAVEGTAVGNFVSQNNVGWVIPYNEGKLKNLILFINENPQEILLKIKNIEKIINENTWEARVMQIANDLGSVK